MGFRSFGLLASAAFIATPAIAQEAPPPSQDSGDKISEIVVTAQRRTESVQDVPISITVVSGDQVARQGLDNVQDLGRVSASVEFTTSSASPGGGGFMRGIGTQALGGATAVSSVGVVVDGVVQGPVPIQTLLDIDHVEVLKGPQGTLFGSSVSAGVLNITTKRPDFNRFSGHFDSEIGAEAMGSGYSRYVVRSSINVPVTARSALRVASQYVVNEGISHNVYTGKDSLDTNFGIRAHYLAELSDALTFNLIGDFNQGIGKRSGALIYRYVPATGPLADALALCGVTPSPDNTENCSDQQRYSLDDSGGVSGQLDLDLGAATLTSITSYRASRNKSFNDILGIPADISRSTLGADCGRGNSYGCSALVSLHPGVRPDKPQVRKANIFTQEVRLTSPSTNRLEWVVGAYYQAATYNSIQPTELAVVAPTFFCVNIQQKTTNSAGDCLLNTSTQYRHSISRDYAAFANLTFHLTDSTRLIGGARYTHSSVSEIASADLTVASPIYGSTTVKGDALTWRAALQHDFGRDTMVYATVSTGYKAPQINDQTITDLLPVKPERPTSYEIGIKQTAFDGRLAINADAYYMHVRNFQSQSCIQNTATGTLACAQVNVPKVITKGIEADIFGRPFTGMTVNISAIYNDAKYPANFFGADGTDLEGHQLNFAPKYKVTASIEQKVPLSEALDLVMSADMTMRGKQSMYLSSLPQFVVPGQTIFGGRIGVAAKNGWAAYIFARNLGNSIYPNSLYPTTAFYPGGIWQSLDANSQRLVGVQLQGEF